LGVKKEIMVTGGVAKIESVILAIEEKLGETTVRPSVDPRLVAAIGATLAVADR
jgi:activator of 2-hydroxyglutaryl-CoA dehydratase